MDRTVSAELHEAFGKQQTKLCPFCRHHVEEGAEHIFRDCLAWAEVRAGPMREIKRTIDGTVRLSRIVVLGKWPKRVRSTGLMPRDERLDRLHEEHPQEDKETPTRADEAIVAGTAQLEPARAADCIHGRRASRSSAQAVTKGGVRDLLWGRAPLESG